jgi:hypothetical protein
VVVSAVALGGTSLVLVITKGIIALADRAKAKKALVKE